MRAVLLATFVLTYAVSAVGGIWDDDYDREAYEEPAGASFAFYGNPSDDIYGIAVGSGTWIRDTPIFGDYAIRLFYNGIEETTYSGLAMTIRIMPHWRLAPFVGAGGSYNHAFSEAHNDPETDAVIVNDESYDARGESYWGGHAETGLRLWFPNRIQLLELMGRYTWSSSSSDRDYWLVALSTGVGI